MFVLLGTYSEPLRSKCGARAIVAVHVLDTRDACVGLALVEVELATRAVRCVKSVQWDSPEFDGFMAHSAVRASIVDTLTRAGM